jgi:hypothetical protein
MADIFSRVTNEWTVVDSSPQAVRRIVSLVLASVVSVAIDASVVRLVVPPGIRHFSAQPVSAYESGGSPSLAPSLRHIDQWADDKAHAAPNGRILIENH